MPLNYININDFFEERFYKGSKRSCVLPFYFEMLKVFNKINHPIKQI